MISVNAVKITMVYSSALIEEILFIQILVYLYEYIMSKKIGYRAKIIRMLVFLIS